jgi:hypothetical protein
MNPKQLLNNSENKIEEPAKPRPSRIKATVTGTLTEKPVYRQDGVIELAFQTEMNEGLPKGLPNLGSSWVLVWCNQRQWNKVKEAIQPDSRLIAEGEACPQVTEDGQAYIVVICTRLTTPELEQARNVQKETL